jgi:hypothetical protein
LGIEMLLILSGSAIAVAAIGIIVYEKIPSSGVASRSPASSSLGNEAQALQALSASDSDQYAMNDATYAENPESPVIKPKTNELTSSLPMSGNMDVSEAPPPFPEEQIQPGIGSNIPLPSDTTAIANIAGATDTNASSTSSAVLVVAAPKRRVRAKRLPSTTGATVRKRRAPKTTDASPASVVSSPAESAGTLGQQQSE